MSKLTVFQRQASVGASVTLRLTRGEDIKGLITELDEHHVCVDLGSRIVTIFDDILAGWEVHQLVQPEWASATSGNKLKTTEPGASPTAESQKAEFLALDPAILARRAGIDACYSEGAKHARLEPPEPDFSCQEGEYSSSSMVEIKRELDRARSQYEYALKVREQSRFTSIVAQILQPLSQQYPKCSAIQAVLGCMLLKIGRVTDAVESLRTAALASRKPEHWYAVAFAAAGSALECHALRLYLLTKRTAEDRNAWLRYFSVAILNSDAAGIIQLLEHGFSSESVGSSLETAAETLIYVYGQIGAADVAVSTTAVLVRGEKFPPNQWQEPIVRLLGSPSQELTREQSHLATQRIQAQETLRTLVGTIVSFGSGGFGFLERDGGEKYFFGINDVVDEVLKQVLRGGGWRSCTQVEFIPVPSPGHRYDHATQVFAGRDIDALVNRVQKLIELRQHPQAMAIVRAILASNPENPQALKFEKLIQQEIWSQGIGLPKGAGPYRQAKQAQLLSQDLQAAEKLFRQAIQQGDRIESAIKDLASLLHQEGRLDEALSLLESRQKQHSGSSPYDNALAHLYQQVGNHEKAVPLLEKLLRYSNRKARPTFLRRIAYSHFKIARYDEAERVLRTLLAEAPDDQLAMRWLAGLEEARKTGSYADADEMFEGLGGLAEQGIEISLLGRNAIDNCSFEGVSPAKVQSGALEEKDALDLVELANQLGVRRPRDRAAYYLSAAAIFNRLQKGNEALRLYGCLRSYFVSMGDAAWADKRPADVVRTYYLEALALVSKARHDAWFTLIRYFATFAPDRRESFEDALPRPKFGRSSPRSPYLRAVQTVLSTFPSSISDVWVQGLLEVSSRSGFAFQAIWECITENDEIQRAVAGWLGIEPNLAIAALRAGWEARCSNFAKARQNWLSVCRTLTRYQLTAASMEDLSTQLRNLMNATLCELDKRRLGELLDIASSAVGFCRASEFEEKEQYYWLITTRARDFCSQVRSTPTPVAHSGLLPIAEHLQSVTEEEYAQITRTSAALLEVRLLVDGYVRGKKGEVKLQVEVANRHGCSPASSVTLELSPPDSPYFYESPSPQELIATLRGGAAVVSRVTLKLREKASTEPAFPIKARVKYRNRVGEDCWSDEVEWTVRLYSEQEFQTISNRYAPYAEGGPVDDPQMFVGRENLLSRLEESLLTGSSSKCIVMFGQKRAGKSSLLEHLRRRLIKRGKCIPAQLSLLEVCSNLDEAVFYYQILQSISKSLADLRTSGALDLPFMAPSLSDLKDHPTLRFIETMDILVRDLHRVSGARGTLVVLLIDEFTEAYKQIRKGKIAAEFMKAWKAVVEKRYFASVLVGQDIMPAFKLAFPNEFGVTEDVRITYLTEIDAKRLIEEPVGPERYIGEAVQRIISLTAGSPFYTMMFCSRLVDYMNRTRASVVTAADISIVEQELISGDRRLTRDKFDNLICAGDGIIDSGINPDETFQVCTDIAHSGERGWCSRDTLQSFEEDRLETLLTDLDRRDVVERKGDAYRLRVGLFRDWLLA